jgi:hypothetical protein
MTNILFNKNISQNLSKNMNLNMKILHLQNEKYKKKLKEKIINVKTFSNKGKKLLISIKNPS